MSDNWRPQERGSATRYRAGVAPTSRRSRPAAALGPKPWSVDIIGDERAHSAVGEYRRALGLVYYEPMSDSQRLAFETAYTSRYVDFYAFVEAIHGGCSLPDAIAGGIRAVKEREGVL